MTALAFPGVFLFWRSVFRGCAQAGLVSFSNGVGGHPMGKDDLDERIAKAQAELDAQAGPSKNSVTRYGQPSAWTIPKS